MKAQILGREIEVRWEQFLTVTAIIAAVVLVFSLLVGGLAYFSDGKFLGPSFTYYSGWMTKINSIIIGPLYAWLILRFSPKGKRDKSFCLSMAGGVFLFESAFRVLSMALIMWVVRDSLDAAFIVSDLLGILAGITGAALGSIIIYWWMLFLLKNDKARARTSAVYGVLLALGFYALSYLAVFVMEYSRGTAYVPSFGLNDVVGFSSRAVFGFITLYFAGGRKIVWNDAYLFGGLYLAGAVLGLASSFILDAAVPGGSMVSGDAIMLADRAVWLALLYIAAINWKDSL